MNPSIHLQHFRLSSGSWESTIQTNRRFRVSDSPHVRDFRLWEEAREPKATPDGGANLAQKAVTFLVYVAQPVYSFYKDN